MSDSLNPVTPTVEELSPAEMRARITALEGEVKAFQLRGKQEQIEQPDGTVKTVADSSADIKREVEGWYLTSLQARRQSDELTANQPAYKYQSPALCPTQEAVEQLLGRTKVAKMTPQQRAQARDVRQVDVDALNPADYFGRKSDSRKAHELGTANPTLYALLKAKAVREGVF